MKLPVLSHLFPNNHAPTFGIFVLRQLEQLARLGVEIIVVSPVPNLEIGNKNNLKLLLQRLGRCFNTR